MTKAGGDPLLFYNWQRQAIDDPSVAPGNIVRIVCANHVYHILVPGKEEEQEGCGIFNERIDGGVLNVRVSQEFQYFGANGVQVQSAGSGRTPSLPVALQL